MRDSKSDFVGANHASLSLKIVSREVKMSLNPLKLID